MAWAAWAAWISDQHRSCCKHHGKPRRLAGFFFASSHGCGALLTRVADAHPLPGRIEVSWGGRVSDGATVLPPWGRRSRRRPASARDRGTSLCRSTPMATGRPPSARRAHGFARPCTALTRRATGGVARMTPRFSVAICTEVTLCGPAPDARRRPESATEAATFKHAEDAVPRGHGPSGTWMCHGPS